MKSIDINGKEYRQVVLRVLSTREGSPGVPQTVEVMLDDDKIDLNDGKPREFVTAFISANVLKGRQVS